ncbi:hypothetical protein KCU59_g32, partial [Aureobasidium melanogenum]
LLVDVVRDSLDGFDDADAIGTFYGVSNAPPRLSSLPRPSRSDWFSLGSPFARKLLAESMLAWASGNSLTEGRCSRAWSSSSCRECIVLEEGTGGRGTGRFGRKLVMYNLGSSQRRRCTRSGQDAHTSCSFCRIFSNTRGHSDLSSCVSQETRVMVEQDTRLTCRWSRREPPAPESRRSLTWPSCAVQTSIAKWSHVSNLADMEMPRLPSHIVLLHVTVTTAMVWSCVISLILCC